MSQSKWINIGVLTVIGSLFVGCVAATDPDVDGRADVIDSASESVASVGSAVTYVCSGQTLAAYTDYVQCNELPGRGLFAYCTPYYGCHYDPYTGCTGTGYYQTVTYRPQSCSKFSTSDCPNYPGCSVTEKCETHCGDANTLIYCPNEVATALACQYGCAGTSGAAYCKAGLTCDESCVWQYSGSYGSGDIYVESYTAANSCGNKTKSVVYKTGVCGSGVIPCQTVTQIQCR